MTHVVICQAGGNDDFSPSKKGASMTYIQINKKDGHNAVVAEFLENVQEHTGIMPSTTSIDLLTIAITIYAADLSVIRKDTTDGWQRDFHVHIPVLNSEQWQEASPILEEAVQFLTGDNWKFTFRQRDKESYMFTQPAWRLPPDAVCLFSGGLDSFIGAIDLASKGKKITLVGHGGKDVAIPVQSTVFASMKSTYGDLINHLPFRLYLPHFEELERSKRSRSILFLSLGILVASSYQEKVPLIVAENGLISLNIPLNETRMGTLSTRTTHPHFIALFRKLLEKININTPIHLPYGFKTKGEMIEECLNQELMKSLLPETMSCTNPESSRFKQMTPGIHCGHCIPCIVRRASINAAGITDKTLYCLDVLTDPPSADKDSGSDLRAIQMRLEELKSIDPSDLFFEMQGYATLPPDDLEEYLELYMRGMKELESFLIS